MWGAKYRDKIDVITCVKSVTTPKFEYPIRLAREAGTGVLSVHLASRQIISRCRWVVCCQKTGAVASHG